MTQLEDIFEELGLTQYLDSFVEQGFDTWKTCLDIRESDFDALQVKLGHRRKLERRIAAYRGVDNRQALAPNKAASPSAEDIPHNEDAKKMATPKVEGQDGAKSNLQPTGKRKYRRHAKPDENAPERPPSAYVIFSNKMREDLKGRSLSFTEIAKLVGENWQTLNPSEKEPYEAQAFALKEKYTIKLAEYRQTEDYKTYSEYLADFKAKQQYQLESSQDGKRPGRASRKAPKLTESANHEGSKRPKLENVPSHSSSSTVNSSSSSHPRNEGVIMEIPAGSKGRNQSVGAPPPSSWITGEAMVHQTPLPAISSAPGGMAHVRRESLVTAPQIPWREQTRPIELPIHGYALQMDQRPLQGGGYTDSPVSYFQRFPSQKSSVGGFTPPLLTSQSTDSTVKSSVSSGSGDSRHPYYAPRTPLDDTRNAPSLPLPSLYGGSKPPGTFDNILPPIRHASLSPSSSMNVPYKPGPPSSMAIDFQPVPANRQHSAMFPLNRLPPSSHHTIPQLYRHGSSSDDNNTPLDPISALIHAGEIVNTQGHQQQNKQPPPHEQPHQNRSHHQQR